MSRNSMMGNVEEWDWVELPAKNLAGHSFESLTAQFRGTRPVGLLTDFEKLSGYTVLNIFSPRHSAFWAVATHSNLLRSTFDSLRHLHDDAVARSLFLKELHQAKIRTSDRQIRLFSDYAQLMNVGGKGISGLGEGPMNYSETLRFRSLGFPTKFKRLVMEYLETQVKQFGAYAFFRIDESVRLADPRGRSSVGAYLFHNIDFLHYGQPAERERFKNEVLAELEFAVQRLEGGAAFDTPIEPIWIIKGGVGFALFGPMLENPPEFEDEVSRAILSYRSRLIRLLGWPHLYHAVVTSLEAYVQQSRELDLGALAPYDVETELRSYIEEMRARYPVLEQAAFEIK